MIELEIQALSEKREGLLIEVGRCVVASGFVLQRQRLAQDDNGVQLTMVVRGPARKQRTLAAALDAYERIISYTLSVFDANVQKPHFAARSTIVRPAVAPLPAPVIDVVPHVVEVAVADVEDVPESIAIPIAFVEPERQQAAEPDFIFAPDHTPEFASQPPSQSAPVVHVPFVELIPTGPDVDAVDKMSRKLANDYPQIFPRLLTLDHSVAAAARESSLLLVGHRMGVWLFERDHRLEHTLGLSDAIERIGIPALAALVDIEHHGNQLHIRQSPICTEGGRSRCMFFTGYLEGLLGPVVPSVSLSVLSICCRSYGADECVLALLD